MTPSVPLERPLLADLATLLPLVEGRVADIALEALPEVLSWEGPPGHRIIVVAEHRQRTGLIVRADEGRATNVGWVVAVGPDVGRDDGPHFRYPGGWYGPPEDLLYRRVMFTAMATSWFAVGRCSEPPHHYFKLMNDADLWNTTTGPAKEFTYGNS